MGIFQKKSGDFVSLFGRHKKEKMTLKENEDEKSLVSLPKPSRTQRKVSRKNKNNAKFRRLREDCDERSSPPEYEPPKGFEVGEPYYPPKLFSDNPCNGDEPAVPDAINISVSASDTVSTLEGSLIEIIRKEQTKKKETLHLWQADKKQAEKQKSYSAPAKSNGWVLNFAEKPFGELKEETKPETSHSPKVTKTERKVVKPKFYPLEDGTSSQGSSGFGRPTFDDPFPRQNEANINFTHSEEFENDENVEKVSSVGSDDFHQFVVKMPPGRQTTPLRQSRAKSKRDETMKKAAETIAISLSSSTPPKSRSRMFPKDGIAKRSRKVLSDASKKPLRNVTPTKTVHAELTQISSEPRRLRSNGSHTSQILSQKSDPLRFKLVSLSASSCSRSVSVQSHADGDSGLLGHTSREDSHLKEASKLGIESHSKEMGIGDPHNPHEEDITNRATVKHNDDGDSSAFDPPEEEKISKKDHRDSFHSKDHENVQKLESSDPFHIGTFSQPSDPIWSSHSESSVQVPENINSRQSFDSRENLIDLIRISPSKPENKDMPHSFDSPENLIDLIRISSRRSDDEASKKPDPSPKSRQEVESEQSFKLKAPSTFQVRTKNLEPQQSGQWSGIDEEAKNIFLAKSSSFGPSANLSNPSGVPSNAILGSMLFRHAHSESTMALPGEQGRPSDVFNVAGSDAVPDDLELDMMEQQTVSSVTEDAGSFYHENFERWNNRAHRALNNLYSTYHSASANFNPYLRGARDVAKETTFFEA